MWNSTKWLIEDLKGMVCFDRSFDCHEEALEFLLDECFDYGLNIEEFQIKEYERD